VLQRQVGRPLPHFAPKGRCFSVRLLPQRHRPFGADWVVGDREPGAEAPGYSHFARSGRLAARLSGSGSQSLAKRYSASLLNVESISSPYIVAAASSDTRLDTPRCCCCRQIAFSLHFWTGSEDMEGAVVLSGVLVLSGR
jgi:hypothetical protein